MKDWVEHSLTHFRNVGPPDSNRCCFCNAQFTSIAKISDWARRIKHVAYHYKLGDKLAYAGPDFELYTYLWCNRLITNAEYRDLKGNHDDRVRATSAYSPYLEESPKAYIDTYQPRRYDRGRQGRGASSG